jgi:uncharacterized repeat protein (TIGR04076 family)
VIFFFFLLFLVTTGQKGDNHGKKRQTVTNEFTIVATVINQKGQCAAGHQVGDQVVFDGQTVGGKVCIHALHSFLPKVFALRNGANFPCLDDPDVATHACSDAWNPVVFEIRRIRT